MWIIALFTGVRVSELEQIKLEDIRKDVLIIRHGKGDKEREIPLHEVVIKAINEFMTVRKGKRDNYLFDIKKRRMQELIKYYAKKCNLDVERLSMHKLRHTAFSMLINNGEDIRVIQEIAGHSSLLTTQIYTSCNKTRKTKAINSIELTY